MITLGTPHSTPSCTSRHIARWTHFLSGAEGQMLSDFPGTPDPVRYPRD
eukprot:CAMPEP_0118960144 /NCGR_PEP_ID=MMETSP1169-20130426/63490_1 /TAXON_ID=36882 /ORGANISM="Pyramimonas obovata, Strain CCMP722" /LENGTH=48 /DNA_ID= /DNA_START= /DNA_END= /DNA_ORIENTATION=